MSLSYEYAIGSVRARELSLLTRQDYEQLLTAGGVPAITAWLQNKGYGEGETPDEILSSHRKRLWKYLADVAPDLHILDCFLIENDIHNVKTAMKGLLSGRDCSRLMLEPSTVPPEEVRTAAESQRFDRFPEWLASAAGKAFQLLAHAADGRGCDALLDRAAMERMLDLAKESGEPFLFDYIRMRVFYADIKLALRAARTGAKADFLQNALCPVPELNCKELIRETLRGEEALVAYLGKISAYRCDVLIDAYRSSGGSAFEKQADEQLIAAAEPCKLASAGAAPLIGYYLAAENEMKAVHIIVSSVATGMAADRTRERMRGIYG